MAKVSPSRGARLTYAEAGVDIDAGNEAVRRIRSLVERTRRPEQLTGLGGFAGAMGLPAGIADPVLVSCADGVGTKLLVAIAAGRHDTVGIDLVAMNVNDLLVTGAQPLFVLDYIACAKVEPAVVEALVAGIAEGCVQAGCALLGGETAELPGMYAPGHYDLAAFCVGVVDRGAMWDPAAVRAGDVVLGLPSSGLHSNGYSLARRALLDADAGGLALTDPLPGTDHSVADALLTPTRIYGSAFAALRALPNPADRPVRSGAHITGGGLVENPQRGLPDDVAVQLQMDAIPRPAVMRAIAAQGVDEHEMRRTFNCGVGMLLYVAPARAAEVQRVLEAAGETVLQVGAVVPRGPGDPDVQFGD